VKTLRRALLCFYAWREERLERRLGLSDNRSRTQRTRQQNRDAIIIGLIFGLVIAIPAILSLLGVR
jgi:hypothetical protein